MQRRRDPWPSPQPSWADPPWVLHGRVVTAWFEMPLAVLAKVLSPDLAPVTSASVRARLRFYDLSFDALGAATGQSAVEKTGRFREAAIGVPAVAGALKGEVSVFLWADSDTYLMWAREAFGWPVRRAEVDLRGSVWTAEELDGRRGEAEVRDPWGDARVTDIVISRESTAALAGDPVWLTPRRLLHCGGLNGETRQLLVVRPAIRNQGRRFIGTASASFSFPPPHPLADLRSYEANVEAADGIELVVGANVEVV